MKKNDEILVGNFLLPTKKSGQKVIKMNYLYLRSLTYQMRHLLAKEHLQFSDVAFLYRNNYLSMRIEQELIAQKIPYEILGSFKFIAREEIKDVLAFLRAILFQDNLSLLRILNLLGGIGMRTVEKIENNSARLGVSIYHYLNNYQNINHLIEETKSNELKLSPQQQGKILEFILKVNNHKDSLNKKKSLVSSLDDILNSFTY